MSLRIARVYNPLQANKLDVAAAEIAKTNLTGHEVELLAKAFANNKDALNVIMTDTHMGANAVNRLNTHAKVFNKPELTAALSAHSLHTNVAKQARSVHTVKLSTVKSARAHKPQKVHMKNDPITAVRANASASVKGHARVKKVASAAPPAAPKPVAKAAPKAPKAPVAPVRAPVKKIDRNKKTVRK